MPDISEEYLRSQRDRAVVLKTNLARIRSAKKCALVVVLEGSDDLVVYDVWFRRIAPSISWEALVAKGKKNSLAFLEMLRRDRTGISVCTYFIVDHDYDGLMSSAAGDDIYVVPAHSVENFLSDSDVLESVLMSDLQILGDPELRGRITSKYQECLTAYSSQLEEACCRLFGSKNANVGNVVIDEKFFQRFAVTLDCISVNDGADLCSIVATQFPVPENGIAEARVFFKQVKRQMWIRGKFLIAFLRRWIELLFEDRKSEAPTFFPLGSQPVAFSHAICDMRNLAAKSSLPVGLEAFLLNASQRCASDCTE